MRVNEIATKTGVTPDTVRYYTRIGLLTPTKNAENGYKNYNSQDEKRLNFIIKARHLGFSIVEIQEIVKLSDDGRSPCCRVREIVRHRLEEAERTIEELQQLHDRMKRAADTWSDMPDSDPGDETVCNLIEMWEDIELNPARHKSREKVELSSEN